MGQHADDEIAREMKELYGIEPEPSPKQQMADEAMASLKKVPFIHPRSSNNNVHIIIEGSRSEQRLDYWPTTDRWKIPGNPQNRYTLHALLDYIYTNWK